MRKAVVVLGLGNPLMRDEGVGVYLVQRLAEFAGHHPSADFIDAGSGGWSVLHLIEGRRKAVMIDCAFMAHQSLHEADLLHVIAMAEQFAQAPKDIVIFGIQPEAVEPGPDLSQTIVDRVDEYIPLILQEIED